MNKKPDREELAKEVYYTAMRHDGHKDWSYCEEWRKQPWRDAVRHVLDKLNQPEPEPLTRNLHLGIMAFDARKIYLATGSWVNAIQKAMSTQWRPISEQPQSGESLLIRRKTEAVEEAQFDGSSFHEHDRPDRVINVHQIDSWTYLYEPEDQQ